MNAYRMTPKEKKTVTTLKARLEDLLGDRMIKFVLFGSRARGDYHKRSDIDIAIVVQGLTRELKHRILDIVAEIELNDLLPLSTLVFSEKDYEKLKKRERRIALDIEREGIPL